MEKREIGILAQLLEQMNILIDKLEKLMNYGDSTKIAELKKQIINIQKEINQIL